MEKVSIIIPIYNVEKYLSECLESAITQDHKNIEIVAINDGSTDRSSTILENFAKQNKNIKIKKTENRGLSAARNTGLDVATGDYVLFLDSDDKIDSHTVTVCISELKQKRADIVFFSANVFCDEVDPKLADSFNYERPRETYGSTMSGPSFFSKSINSKKYIPSACMFLYKRAKLNNIRFLPGALHEDNLFTTELLLKNSDVKVTCIPDKLFQRRLRPESIMTQAKQARHVDGYMRVVEELLKFETVREKSATGIALNHFTQDVLLNAIRSAIQAYGNKIPLSVRKKALQLTLKINPRSLKLKNLAACLLPELLILHKIIKQ